MTVKNLIEKLQQMPQDNMVIIADSKGIGWTNIKEIKEDGEDVKILQDRDGLFHNNK